MNYEKSNQRTDAGILSAKLALVTGVILAGATGGGALIANVSQGEDSSLLGAPTDSSNICVVASYADDDEIIARRGDCEGISGPTQPGDGTPADSNDEVTDNVMETTWDTSIEGCETIKVPVRQIVKGSIDWGDGVTEPLTENITHTYSTPPGEQHVKITGEFSGYGEYEGWNTCLTSVDSWGSGTKTQDLNDAFTNHTALTTVAEIPKGVTTMRNMFRFSPFNSDISHFDTSAVNDMTNMFEGANFNQDIASWDVSNVKTTSGMFAGSTFNQDITDWNISNIEDMSYMFTSTTAFDQPIGKWDVSNVTSMTSMFEGAQAFAHDITSWDVSNVKTTSGMFASSTFNQDISDWDMSSVASISHMFRDNPTFDQPIGKWDVSKVVDMSYTFEDAVAFNRDLSAWDTSNVTNMHEMFAYSNFNKDISMWDVSNVTHISRMFKDNIAFDQPIGKWDVSKVTTMNSAFDTATAFNQDLSKWETGNVTDMGSTFKYARSMNHDLSMWNVNNIGSDMYQDFYLDSGLTTGQVPKFGG